MKTDGTPSGITVKGPPQWATICLRRLCRATGFHKGVGLAVQVDGWPDQVGATHNPDGYLWKPHDPTDPCIIVLPEWAEDSEKWRSVICHEFVHVLFDGVDRFVASTLADEEAILSYKAEVELALLPFVVLAMIGEKWGAEFIPDEEAA
jgi:hypothetical protein